MGATTMEATTVYARPARNTRILLWVIQGALAALFLFAGGMKLAASADALAKMTPLPLGFMRFIGVAEVLGAIGLILPGLLRVAQGLTAFAAGGLVIIMTGATTVTILAGQGVGALVPLAVGALAAFVAYARWEPAPSRSTIRRSTNH